MLFGRSDDMASGDQHLVDIQCAKDNLNTLQGMEESVEGENPLLCGPV